MINVRCNWHLPSSCVVHNDPIVNGESVCGESCYVPRPDLNSLTQGLTQREVIRTRDALGLKKKMEIKPK